jgi:hypothetical protein
MKIYFQPHWTSTASITDHRVEVIYAKTERHGIEPGQKPEECDQPS